MKSPPLPGFCAHNSLSVCAVITLHYASTRRSITQSSKRRTRPGLTSDPVRSQESCPSPSKPPTTAHHPPRRLHRSSRCCWPCRSSLLPSALVLSRCRTPVRPRQRQRQHRLHRANVARAPANSTRQTGNPRRPPDDDDGAANFFHPRLLPSRNACLSERPSPVAAAAAAAPDCLPRPAPRTRTRTPLRKVSLPTNNNNSHPRPLSRK